MRHFIDVKKGKNTIVELNSLPSPPVFAWWSCIVMTHNSCKLHISTEKGSTIRKSQYMLSFSLLPYPSCLLWMSRISTNILVFLFFFRMGAQSFYITATVLLVLPYNHLVHLRFLLLAKNSHQNIWPYVASQSNTIQARNFSTILFPTKRTFVIHLHTLSGCLNCLSSLIN